MRLDALVVADPRFSGGSASAVVADVEALSRAGAAVGVMAVTSRFLDGGADRPNAAVLALPDLPGVERVAPGPASARVALLHHPLAFFHGVHERAAIRADRAALVAHHPPFRGDGSLEYAPLAVGRLVRRALGVRPWWAPVSGLVRRQLGAFAPLIRLTSRDWVNAFDGAAWRAERAAFSGGPPTVGRHGRADPLKWPTSGADVTASLPVEGWRVRVMGCPAEALEAAGADLTGWEVLGFDDEPVARFLSSLDVFAYHHHDRWVEAFGRTVMEAMLTERPCLLDPRLRASFGDRALYCAPAEVAGALSRLRDDPEAARALGRRAREAALREHAASGVTDRLEALARDRGTASRAGASVGWPVAARKLAGLARRRALGRVG